MCKYKRGFDVFSDLWRECESTSNHELGVIVRSMQKSETPYLERNRRAMDGPVTWPSSWHLPVWGEIMALNLETYNTLYAYSMLAPFSTGSISIWTSRSARELARGPHETTIYLWSPMELQIALEPWKYTRWKTERFSKLSVPMSWWA